MKNSAIHILTVDDEQDILDLVEYNLRREGFHVTTVTDGDAALRQARSGRYDLILLDLMLPGIDGMELCKMLKESPLTGGLPVIMLTARSAETDKIQGLDAGADDYVTKPFSPRELIARIRAVLRRAGEPRAETGKIRIGSLETGSLTRSGGTRPLSSPEPLTFI